MGLDQIKVELQESLGSDDSWKNLVKDFKDIDLDLEYNELSHIRFRFHFHVPIFISRQYMRHRNQSPNEMSGRYRTMPNEYFHLPQDVKEISYKACRNIPQDRLSLNWDDMHDQVYAFYKKELDILKQSEKEGFITNTEYKRAREVLRGILGTSFFTDIVATWDLNNLVKFLRLRLDAHAQEEIQEMARQMLATVKNTGLVTEALSNLGLND
jgi:thymidylate synthase (FAD)